MARRRFAALGGLPGRCAPSPLPEPRRAMPRGGRASRVASPPYYVPSSPGCIHKRGVDSRHVQDARYARRACPSPGRSRPSPATNDFRRHADAIDAEEIATEIALDSDEPTPLDEKARHGTAPLRDPGAAPGDALRAPVILGAASRRRARSAKKDHSILMRPLLLIGPGCA